MALIHELRPKRIVKSLKKMELRIIDIDYSRRDISISNCRKFFGEAADTIRNSSPDCLFRLIFSRNDISDPCIPFFDDMARSRDCYKKIIEIDFVLNRITDEGLADLKDLALVMQNLRKINLAYNYIAVVVPTETIGRVTFQY